MVEPTLESTATLIRLIQGGEESARERLVERCLPALKRWAHGRLPYYGRDLAETDDLVQVTFMRALSRLDHFRSDRDGAFLAYLRTILLNAIRDEIRRNKRTPFKVSLSNDSEEWQELLSEASPELDLETIEGYEKALANLPARQGQAVVLKIEFGMTYPEIAAELEYPSANSARMQITRGLVKIAAQMPG